jgi:DNA end-binding protein Ku
MRALKTKQVTAVAKIALRNRESLCVLRAGENALMLETLYYPDEIRTQELGGTPDVLVSDAELNMALSLVQMLEEPFDPKKYHDTYRTTLLEMIEAKRDGQEMVAPAEVPLPQTVDLMAALKASLEAAKRGKPVGAPAAEADEAEDEQQPIAVAF